MTGDSATLGRVGDLPRRAWRLAALGFILALLASLAFLLALLAGVGLAYRDRILPGVSVAGIGLAGLDRAAAEARLQTELPPIDRGTLTLRIGDESRVLTYRALGRRYDLSAMLDAAFDVGRGGSLVDQALDEVRALTRGTSVAPVATYDRQAVAGLLSTTVGALEVPARSAQVVLAAGTSTFSVLPAVVGRTLDLPAVRAEVDGRLSGSDPADLTIDLRSRPVVPLVTTPVAEAAAAQAAALAARPLQLRLGPDTYPATAETLASWLTLSTRPDGSLTVAFDGQRIAAGLADLAGRTDRKVRDATLQWTLGGVKVVPAVEGRQLDVAASTVTLLGALTLPPSTDLPTAVTLKVTTTAPKVSTAEATAAAAKLQLLSSWTTYYVPGEGNYWGRNISIPTNQIDGTVVAAGAWFDFWKVVAISSALGYGPGGAIINGHTQETGALGGGICSCSTTLFNAALRAGLQMGARMNHYYYISRYPRGLDATVYKSDGGWTQTMSFRNDTPYPILIRGINGPGRVTFQLYGVPTGRRVVLSAPTITNEHAATDTIQYTTSLRLGQRERVEWPANGFDASVTRTVYDGSGRVIHRETYHSHYATITGLTLVGGKAPTSPAPGPTPTPPNPSPSPTPAPSPTPSPIPTPTPTP